jgi:ACS family sodium-dependent inorganic phosphate cotransporter
MDRINISVTAPVMMKELGWDAAALGIILSSFFWGYTILQIPGGWLADRYGGKRVLGIGVLWWSLFTMITPVARTVGTMAAFRTFMGVGEGVNFPSIQSLTSRWIPAGERSRVMGFILSGISVGNILAFPLATWIMSAYGWRAVFYSFGVLGFIWFIFWYYGAANRPEEHETIHQHELDYIRANRPELLPVGAIPWRMLCSKPPVCALVINHFCVSWGFFMFLTWLPTYLIKAHGFSLKEMGIYSMFPYLVMVMGSNGAGWLADYCIKQTGNITFIRKLFHSISLVSASVFLILLAQAETKSAVIILVALALGMLSMTGSTTGPNALDIGPRYAGIIMGMQTTAGNIAGVMVPLVVGFIVSLSNRWDVVFYIASAVLVFGTIIWDLFATGRQVLD